MSHHNPRPLSNAGAMGPLSRPLEFFEEPQLGTPRVLVVDDEPYVLRAVERLLREREVEVVTASNGIQAMSILDTQQIALLISDQVMPGMTGIELLRYASSVSPKTLRILLTGQSDINTAVGAINDGEVYRFITKPWRNDEFVNVIDLAIAQHRLSVNQLHHEEYIQHQNDRLRGINDELERRIQARTRALEESRAKIDQLYAELQQSFDATLQIILSVMELGDIQIVEHCRRTTQRVSQFIAFLELQEQEARPLMRATMLHLIGLINAPGSLLGKHVEQFDHEERAAWEFHPLLAQQILDTVPALRRSGQIILNYLRDYEEDDFFPGAESNAPQGIDAAMVRDCQILKICSMFERVRTVRQRRTPVAERITTEEGLVRLRQGAGRAYDPTLVSRFAQMLALQHDRARRELTFDSAHKLREGMILSRPLETRQGVPIAPSNIPITPELIERLLFFEQTHELREIFVWSHGPDL